MPDSSEVPELERISMEMNSVSLKRQQLWEKRNMLLILHEFKNHVSYRGPVEGTPKQPEVDCIDDQLRQLSERLSELQVCQDRILHAQGHKKDNIIFDQSVVPGSQDVFNIHVEPPPSIPGPGAPVKIDVIINTTPKVILDIKQLPFYATRTQCPECHQYITTETMTSVGSLAWLACFVMTMMGCVAGCCFIPFCMDSFKDVIHKCPRCRSLIQTVEKL